MQQTSGLTASAVAQKLAETTPPQSILRPLDSSLLKFTPTTTPMTVPRPNDPINLTSYQCTDHMVTAMWHSTSGWDAPELKPYGNLSLAPTASVLHYATECFEGMKIYRGYDGRLRLFRPDRNCRRMLTSATRILLPRFDPKKLENLIIAMVAVHGLKWLPKSRLGSFLYLRPTMIRSAPTVGVASP